MVRPEDMDVDDDFNASTKPPEIELRLTVPSNGRELGLIQSEIQAQLMATDAFISNQGPISFVPSAQAMYEDEILEAIFPIRFGFAYNTVREASIKFARDFCNIVGHGLHEAVRLEFLSPDSYYLRCKPDHYGLQAAAFSLGSFRNYGVFEDHYEQIGGPRPIAIDFQHDSKRMDLYCMFQADAPAQQQPRNMHRGNRQQQQQPQSVQGVLIYRVHFPYSSIHSIVVDFAGQTPATPEQQQYISNDRHETTVLYIRLKHPPRIEAAWAKTNNQNRGAQQQQQQALSMTAFEMAMSNRRYVRYERVRELVNCPAATIGKCNVLKVVLKKTENVQDLMMAQSGQSAPADDGWYELVNEIVSRVKTRTNCRVYYTGIRNKPGGPPPVTMTDQYVTSFKCFYLLKALISTRSYTIEDQISMNFFIYVKQCIQQNERAAEIALSQLLAAADESRYFSLLTAFRKIFEVYANEATLLAVNSNARSTAGGQLQQQRGGRRATNATVSLDDEPVAKNCVKVRKLVVTPTREMLLAPEVIVSNRVLRKFGEEYALRVVIRDEDGQKIQGSRIKNEILKKWLDSLMTKDYVIGERRYRFLGWSNSQLRDHAFYMFANTADGSDIAVIRKWMGDFTAIQNVPKLMSRMGQCFTQAQTSLDLPWGDGRVGEEDDIMGGDPDPNTGDLYCFSDGIGRMSMNCATEVCRLLDVTPVRSAYQIRYAGFKGMLSVDPALDTDPDGKMVMLRKSMHKFESDKSHTLEIVKYSMPSPVYLNRPLVMILDQVSEKSLRRRNNATANMDGRSENVHRKVCNRIHELLDDELFAMAEMLLDENASVIALSTRTTLNINFRKLKEAGFSLTIEPFFRGLLLAIHQYTIKQQLWKQKIEVPIDQGRTLYGVLDTTKLLQYGQVFLQYSKDLNKPGEDLIIVEGLVMVTKNPCIVPGDVRILRAVNIPNLKHMFDVIVFPQNGPRPHTDEMAGSDLDGDEYSVYWDPILMFDERQMQKPMHFPKNKPMDVDGGVNDRDMVEFFARYLQQNSIGSLSYAHLAKADLDGLFCPVAMNIALKCSMAVDFPKTGVPAEPLTEEERPYKWPDFFEKFHEPMYRSSRLIGKLYRRVKNASDIIRIGQDSVSRPAQTADAFDEHLLVPGWERYKDEAVRLRNQYVQYLQMLLDQYGVTDESSLISGHMVTIRNRLSDGEKEDFSFYNTEKIIEWRLSQINRKFRRKFFDEETGEESEEALEHPSEQMQQKASAWYWSTYCPSEQQTMRGRIMLSFPWMVWEILRYIKFRRMFDTYARRMEERIIDPTAETLAKTIQEYCRRCSDDVARYVRMLNEAEAADTRSEHVIAFYLDAYRPDFAQLSAVVLHWAEKEIGFDKENSLKPVYIIRLLVDFCQTKSYLERRAVLDEERAQQGRVVNRNLVSIGDILLEFLKYLASFKHREDIARKICDDQATINLRRRQLRLIGQVAFKSYHHVAWTNRFDSLHLENESRRARAAMAWDREEMEPITILLEHGVTQRVTEEEVEKRLKIWSGAEDVRIRRKGHNQDDYLVTAAGRLESRQSLHDLLLSPNLQECLIENKNPLLDMEI